MTDQPALPGLETTPENGTFFTGYGTGPTEKETRRAIKEIEERKELTGSTRTIAQLAIALATSIDRGTAKGRAIANEAAQLLEMMTRLDPPTPDDLAPEDSTLTTETKNLIAAYAAEATTATDWSSPPALRDS